MADLATDRFTLGVFKDVPAAEQGLEALIRHGFGPGTLSIIAKSAPEVDGLIQRVFGTSGPPASIEVAGLGPVTALGPVLAVLDAGAGELAAQGIAGTARHAGFQSHDGVIFERLVARGGILVGVSSEARSSEALETLHAYGGGNAAIGAWAGRV